MKLTLSEQYAIVALDGQESIHTSTAKSAVIRAVVAAQILEKTIDKFENCSINAFIDQLEEAVYAAKNLKKKEEKKIEQEIANDLEKKGILTEKPDLLGCDMNYYSSGIELKTYCSNENIYLKISEGLRAELLEDGEVSIECLILLWLLRESGCIHDIFTLSEQDRLHERMIDITTNNEIYHALWKMEFYSIFESISNRIIKTKSRLFQNPYLEGINLFFPYLERRKSIFIDNIIWGTNVKERRIRTISFLEDKGFKVEEVKLGNETLLKIDKKYYRIFPMTKRVYKVPVQGINLVPVYL